MNVTIENPLILVLAAIFSAIPIKNNRSLVTVQKLILFYLACVITNLLSDEYFTISAGKLSANISYAIIIVAFFCSMLFIKNKAPTEKDQQLYNNILVSWAIVWVLIITHMAFLFCLLKFFYNHGYEHDLKTISAVSSCFILFLCMWNSLNFKPIRLILGIAFAFIIPAIANGALL